MTLRLVRCQVTVGCKHRAYAHIYMADSPRLEGSNTCRPHSAVVIAEYLIVSDDIRVKEAF